MPCRRSLTCRAFLTVSGSRQLTYNTCKVLKLLQLLRCRVSPMAAECPLLQQNICKWSIANSVADIQILACAQKPNNADYWKQSWMHEHFCLPHTANCMARHQTFKAKLACNTTHLQKGIVVAVSIFCKIGCRVTPCSPPRLRSTSEQVISSMFLVEG